jgi:hypothetical protein
MTCRVAPLEDGANANMPAARQAANAAGNAVLVITGLGRKDADLGLKPA